MLQDTESEYLALGILALFAIVALIVFRERRWQGALGWIMIAGAFIVSVLRRNTGTLLSSTIAAVVIVVGIGLAGYDYVRFERPKRRQRRAAGTTKRQSIIQRVRGRRRFRRRPDHHDDR